METTGKTPDNTGASGLGIDLVDVTLDYNGSVLFQELSLHIAAGQWTCLLGPSGVGKSTLLRIIAGLENRQSGSVACSDRQELSGRIAYMAQQDLLFPWLTLAENALLGPRLRGQRSKQLTQRALALLERVGLGNDSSKLPSACSGGMRQRAAVVRTLMEARPVVLMDEPFSALDAITRLQLQEIAGELLASHTVLLVTHDPLEALRLGHRIHVMKGSPARLDEPITLNGAPPRHPGDPDVMKHHAELLAHLSG